MSCSKWLLNKKGPLETVWVAAFRRAEALTRDQVMSTDIAASVDKILQDGQAPQRILALLLLGIVKIYCRKVQYLCDDCQKISHSFGPSTSTGRSVQVKEAVQVGRKKDTNKVKKSIHTARITKISGSISSESLRVRREIEINVQTSVVIREECVSVDMPTFTMPERFELDSFDLGIADDIFDDDEDHHQSRRQDISLEDERRNAPFLYELNQRVTSSYAVDFCCLMPEYISVPSEVIDAISDVNNILGLSSKGHESGSENQNADSVWFTPVKDVLPPETMTIMAEGNDHANKRKMADEFIRKVNMEEDADSTCSTLLPESQQQQISEDVTGNMNSVCPSASYPTTEEMENGLFIGKSNTGPHVGGFHENETEENDLLGQSNTGPPVGGFQEHEVQEHESLEPPILSCKTQAIDDLSPSTPEPLPEGIPGPPLSSTFKVKTPAKIERRQSNKKRKRKYYNDEDYVPTEKKEKRPRRRVMLDEVLILSNDMMNEAIRDPSDTTRIIKKAPQTCLDNWRVAKIGSLPDNFMDPLIPYDTSVILASLTTTEAPENSCGEPVKARRRLSYKLSESSHSCKDSGATEQESIFDGPRKGKLDGRTEFEAPVGCDTENGHLQDDVRGCNNDAAKERGTEVKGDEPISLIQSDKELHESEINTSVHNEGLYAAYDIDQLQDTPMDEEHTRDESLLSLRTRKIARFLHQRFLDQNSNQGTNSLSLNHSLEGKKRTTSALFFYETLVLKSRGLIEVNQEHPYEDIMLSPTPRLEAELQRPSGGTSR